VKENSLNARARKRKIRNCTVNINMKNENVS
jgi:hypothetical protein